MTRVSRRTLLGAAAALGLAATTRSTFAQDAATPEATPGGGLQADGRWVYTDSVGKVIDLPGIPNPVIAQTTSAAALWDLGYQVAGIYGPGVGLGGNTDPQAGNIDLDVVEYLGDFGALDLEKVALISPQIYVDVDRGNGAAWYPAGETQAEFDALVPTLLVQAGGNSVVDTIEQFERLAVALGSDLSAPGVVQAREAWRTAEEAFKSAVAAKPGLKVLAISPDAENVYVVNPNWVGDLIYVQDLELEMIQTPNPDPTTFNNFEVISWENIGTFSDDADVILVDIRNAPDWSDGVPFWETLPAVAAGQVGVWNGVFPFTYAGLAGMLSQLTATIEAAQVL